MGIMHGIAQRNRAPESKPEVPTTCVIAKPAWRADPGAGTDSGFESHSAHVKIGKGITALLVAGALVACTPIEGTDKIRQKIHVEASFEENKNTEAFRNQCKLKFGKYAVASNDSSEATCRVDEQFILEHGKTGTNWTQVQVTKSYFNAVRVGDKWKP